MVSFVNVLGEQVKRIILRLGFLNLREYIVYGDSTRVKLGENVSLNNAILNVASGRIIIGDNVIFGHGIILTTGTHDYGKVGIDRVKAWPRSGRDIVIEDGVMIGSGAIILGKVRVGRNAVVCAGSVVNRDVEPNTLVGGVPAQIVREITYTSHIQE